MVSRVTFIGTREQAGYVIPMSQEDVTMYKNILGKTAQKNIDRDEHIKWEDFK